MGFLGTILLFLGGAAALLGYIWIVVLGFRVSVAQGLSLLVFSRGMRRFASRHPQETRLPMILMIGGGVLLFGGGWLASGGEPDPEYYAEEAEAYEGLDSTVSGAESPGTPTPAGQQLADASLGGAPGSSRPQAAPEEQLGSAYQPPEPASASQPDDFGVDRGRGSYLPAPSSPALPRGFRAQPENRSARIAPKRVQADDADQLLTHRVKVVKKSGNTFRGKLTRVDGDKIVVQQWFGGGSMEISVLLADIERIERMD